MIPYTLVRSDRRTVGIQITPEGQVILRCPRKLPVREAEAILESRRDWVEAHLAKLPRPQGKLTEAELMALARQAAEDLPPRVEKAAAAMGISYGRITVRSQHTRWGSCSAKGNLNFNCLLMLCPEAVRDYVVVHELCHRREMNHSPKFWALVAQYCPDCARHKKWLKDNGGSLIARLP